MGTIRSGLIIKEPWISLILSGEKTWEMRSTKAPKGRRFALIRQGSGSLVGLATIAEVLGPFDDEQIVDSVGMHKVPLDKIRKWRFAWVLKDVVALHEPIKYVHQGGVVWTTLDAAASEQAGAVDELLRQGMNPA